MSANNEEDDDEEDNEMVHTDTYAEYMPMKVKVGYVHPDPVVETRLVEAPQFILFDKNH